MPGTSGLAYDRNARLLADAYLWSSSLEQVPLVLVWKPLAAHSSSGKIWSVLMDPSACNCTKCLLHIRLRGVFCDVRPKELMGDPFEFRVRLSHLLRGRKINSGAGVVHDGFIRRQ